MCLDLSASYAKATRQALPEAVLVADRFHLVRLANDMLTQVRQEATRTGRGRRGRRHDPEWANRRRLLTGHDRLTETGFATMWNTLIDEGDLGVDVLHAYTVKELLRNLLALAPTPGTSVPNHGDISHRPWKLNSQAAACDIPTVHRLAATIEGWWSAVEAAITTGHSNARSWGSPACGGGLQPAGQTPRPQRLRLLQHHQPEPPHTLGLHPPTPASRSQHHRAPRSSMKSQQRPITLVATTERLCRGSGILAGFSRRPGWLVVTRAGEHRRPRTYGTGPRALAGRTVGRRVPRRSRGPVKEDHP